MVNALRAAAEEQTEKWLVAYDVEGTGRHQAGPYSLEEAHFQKGDIATYVGISNVRLEIAPEGLSASA